MLIFLTFRYSAAFEDYKKKNPLPETYAQHIANLKQQAGMDPSSAAKTDVMSSVRFGTERTGGTQTHTVATETGTGIMKKKRKNK